MQPFNRNLHPYNWHWFWDFGNGELGNNGIHYIDVAQWGQNKKLLSKIYSTGGRFGWDRRPILSSRRIASKME